MDVFQALVHTPAFWGSLWALVNVCLLYFIPTFPPEVLAALNVFAAVIFAAITTRGTPARVEDIRATRALDGPD